jgi:FkbM family methyltransferase
MSDANAWTVELASGLRMAVPPRLDSITTYVLLEQERWFEPEIGLLQHLLQPGMQVLDIGANHGVYALEMARLVGRGGAPGQAPGHVWAFEPTSAPRARLARSVALNGLDAVLSVVPAGLAEAASEARFVISGNSELNHRGADGRRHETVQLLSLDGFLAEHAPAAAIGFVKLDAEGGELQVLAGAQHFFATQSPVVMFEFLHGKTPALDLAAAWHALGYDLFRYSEELSLLLPFDTALDEHDFALNLLAVRPAQQQALAQRGLLVTADALAAEPALEMPGGTLHEALLRAVAAVHGALPLRPVQRVRLLRQVRDALHAEAAADAQLSMATWVLHVHALQALGAQCASVALAARLLDGWPRGVDVDQPFLPPLRAQFARADHTGLRTLLAEHLERHTAHSSYFGAGPLRWLAELLEDPAHDAQTERRWLLSHALRDRVAPLHHVRLLADPAQTRNAAIWQGLIAAMAPQAAAA